jgi:hypothetical protein
MAKSRRRLRLMAAALVLSCAAAHPATARVGMYQPKVVADLQLMTASELSLEAMRACDAAVGSRLMAHSPAAVQLGKQSAYLGESQEHRDYLDTVLRVLRAKLGREPLWMVEFKKAALGQDPNACSQAQTHSLKDTAR